MDNLHLAWHTQNKLLGMLSADDFGRLRRVLQLKEIAQGDTILHEGCDIDSIDFPCTAVYSAVAAAPGGDMVEVGMVGCEGFAGVPALFQAARASCGMICIVPGMSLRMALDDFRWEAQANPNLGLALGLYAQAWLFQMERSSLCGRLHTLEQRLARWLLMLADRAARDELHLTQETMAMLHGARRPSVSVVARKLETCGAVEYARGRLAIRSRPLLESLACDCYRAARDTHAGLLGVSMG